MSQDERKPSERSVAVPSISQPDVDAKGPRRRKSNRPYPPSTFSEALKFARAVYEFGSGSPVRKLSFFDQLGKSPDSSAARDSITNANKYGLLKSSFASDTLEITADGISAVGDNIPPRTQARARVKLGIEGVEPFRKQYEKLAGTNRLPARAALVDMLAEQGVPADLLEEATDLFMVNLRDVGLLQVLAGAERVITVDHLLDGLPSESTISEVRVINRQENSIKAADAGKLVTQEHANFESTCFYITPIGAAGSSARKHSDLFLGSLIEPAISSLGLKVVRADTIGQPGIITRQILEYILKARLVIADLSFHNPNVFYELALRHATRLPIVQIVQQSDSIPFDINQMRTISIDNSDLYTFVPSIEAYRSEIAAQARRALESGHEIDTPISVYFPKFRTALD